VTPEEIRLRCLEAVISKAPQGFDIASAIARASQLIAFVTQDYPPKRGPGRPPKQSQPEDYGTAALKA
jgi:hypothetical protein